MKSRNLKKRSENDNHLTCIFTHRDIDTSPLHFRRLTNDGPDGKS